MQNTLNSSITLLKENLANLTLKNHEFKQFATGFYDHVINTLPDDEKANIEIIKHQLYQQLQKEINLAQYYMQFNDLRKLINNWYCHDNEQLENIFKIIAVQKALVQLIDTEILNYHIPILLPEYLSLQAVN
ncbi:hypothetical protein L3V83_11075 [Thiotrichales bacterium 19X7-9]|nr:hypothetical protein [Thiotrichales bacterium 19X7-9]